MVLGGLQGKKLWFLFFIPLLWSVVALAPCSSSGISPKVTRSPPAQGVSTLLISVPREDFMGEKEQGGGGGGGQKHPPDIPFHKSLLPKCCVLPAWPPRAPGCARRVSGLLCPERQRGPKQDVALLKPCQARQPPLPARPGYLPPAASLPAPHFINYFSTGRAAHPTLHICIAQLAGHIWEGYSPKTLAKPAACCV